MTQSKVLTPAPSSPWRNKSTYHQGWNWVKSDNAAASLDQDLGVSGYVDKDGVVAALLQIDRVCEN